MRRYFLLGLSLCGAFACGRMTHGQSSAQPAPESPGYTLHANARVVLTDVVVTDQDGRPVRGLPGSAFHIFDNKKPQKIASFEEHTPGQAPRALEVKAANVYSNQFLLHPPTVFNAIMLDTATIPIVEQMYLNQQLIRFINDLPADQQLAIFVHAGEFTILLQNFTSDHQALLAALAKAIPRLQQPGAANYLDVEALHQMTTYLAQLPGRKNVMWFTGGSNFFLGSDPTKLQVSLDLRALYDELEHARIAIYPIDVRGPVVGLISSQQHQLMEEQADATGGHAFINTNALGESARTIVDQGANFYTLTYAPTDSKFDNKWRKVRVEVEGGKYQLSYRRGYYDDGSGLQAKTSATRVVLKAGGEKVNLPDNRSEPIIFSVKLLPGFTDRAAAGLTPAIEADSAKRGQMGYTLHYTVPVAAFTQTSVDTGLKVRIGAGFLIFNSVGRRAGRGGAEFTLSFKGDVSKTNPDATLSFDQPVALPQGEDYLFIAVWDMTTGRSGTLQVPIVAARR